MMFSAAAQEGVIQVHQGFDKDPGWEWKHNRIVAEDPATVDQNFGWAVTNHTSATEAGEIGGKGWQARPPAGCSPPLQRPFSFQSKISLSFPPPAFATRDAG